MKHILWGVIFLSVSISVVCHANKQESIESKTITFGMSGSFAGHFGFYGNFIKNAILAAFKQCNDSGGINGTTLDLCIMEDESNPMTAKKNIECMLAEKKIDMFLGVMGTRGVLSVLPMIKEKKIAMLFPWASDQNFRISSLKHMINGPGLLESQTEKLVDHIVDDLHLDRVAVFHADDAFSIDAAQELIKNLTQRSMKPVGVAQYNRFTMDIQTPAKKLVQEDPRVVLCIGTSMPTTKLINYFFEQGLFGVTFLGIDSTFLVNSILESKGVKFNYSSPVPNPKTSSIDMAAEYRNVLKRYCPNEEPTTLSFTYYICAKILIHALKTVQGPLSKEAVVEAVEAMKQYDLQGFTVDFDASNRHVFGKKIWII